MARKKTKMHSLKFNVLGEEVDKDLRETGVPLGVMAYMWKYGEEKKYVNKVNRILK